MKDHEFRESVNELKELTLKYANTQQLREQLAYWLRDYTDKVESEK